MIMLQGNGEDMQSDLGEVIIYQSGDGAGILDVHLKNETVWLSQKQIAALFATERSVVTKHIGNVFRTVELDREAVCSKFAHTAEDGKTYRTTFYNLDVIIAVGYRVNAKRGTQFRIWATSVLKDHLGRNSLATFDNRSLVALALLTAASEPGQKELLVRLIVNLIGEAK